MRESTLVITIVVAAAAVIIILIATRRAKQKRSQRLRTRFGPEYYRAVTEHGNKVQAEKALEEREKRSVEIVLHPLSSSDRQEFAQAWRALQTHFVDAPGNAVIEADLLLERLMRQRGYPVGDFAQQVSDLSVDYPEAVGNYCLAHQIADRQRRGEASTEDLREAIIQYRILYEALLDGHVEEVKYGSKTAHA